MTADLTTVVISDIHGDYEGLVRLLERVGAVIDGKRAPGYRLIQIGDLIHFGRDTIAADIRCLDIATEWLDVVLIGNHELAPAFHLKFGEFAGMHMAPAPEITRLLRSLHDADRLRAATEVDGWLITHAGVTRTYQGELLKLGDAAAMAAGISARFQDGLEEGKMPPLLSAVGPYRSNGSDQRPGGIFWADWHEHLNALARNRIRQIVGHTPRPSPKRVQNGPNGQPLWNVDVGAALSGRVAALVKASDDDDWTPIVVDRELE